MRRKIIKRTKLSATTLDVATIMLRYEYNGLLRKRRDEIWGIKGQNGWPRINIVRESSVHIGAHIKVPLVLSLGTFSLERPVSYTATRPRDYVPSATLEGRDRRKGDRWMSKFNNDVPYHSLVQKQTEKVCSHGTTILSRKKKATKTVNNKAVYTLVYALSKYKS